MPSPNRRVETLREAYQSDLKTLVALRPLLPSFSDEELEKIVNSTKEVSLGYYSGPLYLKSMEHPILDKEILSHLKIEKLQPHWMPEGNIFYKVEKEGQMGLLQDIIQRNNKLLFEGAGEAIKYLKNYEKH